MTRRLVAEFLGTAMLLIGVVGSGIMGESLADGNTAVALLANAIATGCVLFVIITCLGPISGAHFNPIVSLVFFLRSELQVRDFAAYVSTQVIAAITGVWAAHFMFDLDIIQLSQTARTGPNQWGSEVFATFGLLFVILGGLRFNAALVPALVALYITGAYWFTSSTSFANPAVTIGRLFTDTFAGINPAHVAGFIAAQVVGAVVAHITLRWLYQDDGPSGQ